LAKQLWPRDVESTLQKLAKKLGVNIEEIKLAWQKRNEYFKVKVESDTRHRSRIVLSANPELKEIQRLLNRKIFRYIGISKAAHGFVPGRSFETFLLPHKNSVEFLNLDFKDAFNQVKIEDVFEFLNEFLNDSDLAKVIALLVTFNGEVPQGVASSPYLFNIACRQLDNDIINVAETYDLKYTRYGDDICLSSENEIDLKQFEELMIGIVEGHGFMINFQKIKYQNANKKTPEVSGIIIENGKFRISKRKGIDYLRGLINRAVIDHSISVEQIEGRLGLLRMISRISGDANNLLPKRLRAPYAKFRQARGLPVRK